MSYLNYTCETCDTIHYPANHLHMIPVLLCWITWLAYFRVFISILWFSFMLLVIACTCLPEPHHLIMYMYDCPSTPIGFILRTRWVIFWQPSTFMSRSRSLNRSDLHSWSECAVEAQISGCLCIAPFLPAPLISSRDAHLATREYFSVFLYCISCFCASWWSNILGILYHDLW